MTRLPHHRAGFRFCYRYPSTWRGRAALPRVLRRTSGPDLGQCSDAKRRKAPGSHEWGGRALIPVVTLISR
jgi:hypothetical protein